jgi:hypothetical protein
MLGSVRGQGPQVASLATAAARGGGDRPAALRRIAFLDRQIEQVEWMAAKQMLTWPQAKRPKLRSGIRLDPACRSRQRRSPERGQSAWSVSSRRRSSATTDPPNSSGSSSTQLTAEYPSFDHRTIATAASSMWITRSPGEKFLSVTPTSSRCCHQARSSGPARAAAALAWDDHQQRRADLLQRLLGQGEAGVCVRSIGALAGRSEPGASWALAENCESIRAVRRRPQR